MTKKLIFCAVLVFLLSLGFLGSASYGTVYGADEVALTCKSALLMDYASGQVLFSKDEDARLPVASMVKMMTLLLTLEEIDSGALSLDDEVVASENASGMGGSQVFLDAYATYSVRDLLKSVIICSANDASVALAEHIAGSESVFVRKMNAKAKALGMNDTNYSNCTGLPAPEQYSSAYDSALVLKAVLGHEIYHQFSGIWIDKLVHPSGRETELVNTNKLIRYYKGCDGGKTGSTNEAGCCLSASAQRDGMRLISVVVGAKNSQTRFNECSSLFNFGFANFESRKILDSSTPIFTAPVVKGEKAQVPVFAQEDFCFVVRKGEKSDFEVETEISSIKAPCACGQCVGEARIVRGGQVVKCVNLVAGERVDALSLGQMLKKVAGEF